MLDYVRGFRYRLYEARAAARRKLGKAQCKMQRLFNRKAKHRTFNVGDKVLALLPLVNSPFQAKYSGPYEIVKFLPDYNYVISTPDLSLTSHLSHLPDLEKADIIGLIESFFPDIPSCTSVIEHDIDVGEASPIKQHAYRVNPRKREWLQKEVDYLLANNLAEPSYSAWSSPCLLVNKPDGTHHFCTDYRRLNSVTKPDCYPLPRCDDCVDRVGSAKYVSKFDLLKGYWQVPLTTRAEEYSAFVTPDNFLQYRVMPFGIMNAASTFQRLVNCVLAGMRGCDAYIDDLVLFIATTGLII